MRLVSSKAACAACDIDAGVREPAALGGTVDNPQRRRIRVSHHDVARATAMSTRSETRTFRACQVPAREALRYWLCADRVPVNHDRSPVVLRGFCSPSGVWCVSSRRGPAMRLHLQHVMSLALSVTRWRLSRSKTRLPQDVRTRVWPSPCHTAFW